MRNSVMFLLGSGVSRPAGFPSTPEITSQVFTGNKVIRHTDSRYYLSENSNELERHWTNDYLPQVLLLLQSIKKLMTSYRKEESLNYEILYYFIQQLDDYESGNYLNMALYPFIEAVKRRMQVSNNNNPTRFIDVFSEAEAYIRHTVWHMLGSVPLNKHSHLSLISDAITDGDISKVNIATLNHDVLMEQHLNDKEISFNDGFGSSVNGVRYWENSFSDRNNLLKIHGSINWFTLEPNHGDWFNNKIGIVLDGDIDHAKSPQGNLMKNMPYRQPHILIGTFNKIYEYTGGVFSEVYYQFLTLLKSTNRLIVSGYSFGDKGINGAILEWLYSDKQNRIIVIHHKPDKLLGITTRLAIRKASSGVAKGNFATIAKNIQETSWKEVKKKVTV